MKIDNLKELEEQGYTIVKNLVETEFLDAIKESVTAIFQKQIQYTKSKDIVDLFNNHNERFANCTKHAQWNLQLHHLGVMLGYKVSKFMIEPQVSICTRPVIYFNNKDTAEKSVHHTTPAHQDSKSMQGSSDALVCWVPLIDITEDLGRLEVVPKSHKSGDLTKSLQDGFGLVEDSEFEFKSVNVPKGSVLVFDSNLVHRSGNIKEGTRWSVHYRFNNMYDPEYIIKGYPHNYTYAPKSKV
jgi:phytanoyl-CoA hydroxylase|tara:strand:+ start:174 stop:896 length:723 start_codon:yes stop_codon:yes gene_type:complete